MKLSLQNIGSGLILVVNLILAIELSAQDGLLIDDAVFAHDFEIVDGDNIFAIVGPEATKSSNIATDNGDPVGFKSQQHLQAPNSQSFATIDTNTQMEQSTTQLSFSIFCNARGDNGNDQGSFQIARLLSSFNGTGFPPNETTFDCISSDGRRLRLSTEVQTVFSNETIPFKDAVWHQYGFVFDSGAVRFYLDGKQLGESLEMTDVESIAPQNFGWFLVEDATAVSTNSEYFDDGDYDEAALWYRALSESEMQSLFQMGLKQATGFTLGDINRDGAVDLLDVAPFVELLTSGDFQTEADINGDGVVNLLDVDPFVGLLSG